MTTATREVLSKIDESKPVTKDDVLRLIPQFELPPVFLRRHLINIPPVIGSTGDRGGGKSSQTAVIAATDGMFIGKVLHSNIPIGVKLNIDDDTAMKYGLNSGGVVSFESVPLEKDALLNLDERFMNAIIVIEEINVEYSNVRRFMSNTNVDFNEVCQQLRKFRCPLYYNVINEMFVDSQLRQLTDIFIKTYDTAFDQEALQNKKPTGQDFCWYVYPMTGYLNGQQGKYEITKKSIGPIYFHFAKWQGIFNTDRYQKQGLYSISTKDKNKKLLAQMNIGESEELKVFNTRYGWLEQKAIEIKQDGITELEHWELAQRLGQPVNKAMRDILRAYGIYYDKYHGKYIINDFNLSNEREKELAGVY